jgi:hypothetical protein
VTSPRAFNKFIVYEIGQTLPHLVPADQSLAMPEQKKQPAVRLDLSQEPF